MSTPRFAWLGVALATTTLQWGCMNSAESSRPAQAETTNISLGSTEQRVSASAWRAPGSESSVTSAAAPVASPTSPAPSLPAAGAPAAPSPASLTAIPDDLKAQVQQAAASGNIAQVAQLAANNPGAAATIARVAAAANPSLAATVAAAVAQVVPAAAAQVAVSVSAAVPTLTASITAAVIVAAPAQATAITTAVVTANPAMVAAVASAAATAAPTQAQAVVNAAATAAPTPAVTMTAPTSAGPRGSAGGGWGGWSPWSTRRSEPDLVPVVDLLVRSKSAPSGFGQYTYLLLVKPSPNGTEAEKTAALERNLKLIRATLGQFGPAADQEALGIKRKRLNQVLIPVKTNLSVGRKDEADFLAVHEAYDWTFAESAQSLLGYAGRRGPFLYSSARVLEVTANREALPTERIAWDLSSAPDSMVLVWWSAFLQQSSRPDFWRKNSMQWMILELRQAVELAALRAGESEQAMKGVLALISLPSGSAK